MTLLQESKILCMFLTSVYRGCGMNGGSGQVIVPQSNLSVQTAPLAARSNGTSGQTSIILQGWVYISEALESPFEKRWCVLEQRTQDGLPRIVLNYFNSSEDAHNSRPSSGSLNCVGMMVEPDVGTVQHNSTNFEVESHHVILHCFAVATAKPNKPQETRTEKSYEKIFCGCESPKERTRWSASLHAASDVEEDLELVRLQILYNQSFRPSELVELREEYLKIAQNRSPQRITLKELEVIFKDKTFVDEEDIDKVPQFYELIASTRKILVFINKATNLVAKDRTGLSDPFVEVLVDYEKKWKAETFPETSVQDQTINPVWEEQLDPFTVQKDSKILNIVLYDVDNVLGMGRSKDYLGSVNIDLATVATQEAWYTLTYDPKICKTPFKVTGEVLLRVEVEGRRDEGSDVRVGGVDLSSQQKLVSFEDSVRILNCSRNDSSNQWNVEIPRFPFNPESYTKTFWDFLLMLLLLFTTFAVPFLLAFGGEVDPKAPLSAYDIFDLCLDVIFCVDIIVTFFTCIHLQGVYVTDLTIIAKDYLCGWFWIDMPGSIPFDKIIIYTSASSDMGPILKILKFIRILKLARAVKFMRKLDQLEEKDRTGSMKTILNIFRSVLIMIFSAHFLGCMFILLRDLNVDHLDDDQANWLDTFDPELRYQSAYERYIACLYWAIATVSTIGYGDVGPKNHVERQYCIIVALIGVIVFAFAMGNITSCMNGSTGVRLRHDEKLRAVAEYLQFRDAKIGLKSRIFQYFCGSWRRGSELHEENTILDAMPRQLKRRMYEHLATTAAAQVPILKGLDNQAIGQIFTILKPVHFPPGEFIYSSREPGGDMYFITHGVVWLSKGVVSKTSNLETNGRRSSIYRSQDLNKHRKVEPRSLEPYFGHISLFHEVCQLRVEDAVARTNTQTLCLTRDDLDMIRGFCPEFYDGLFDICLLSAAKYGASNATVSGVSKRALGYCKIEQTCLDLRKELMVRHQQILTGSPALHESGDHNCVECFLLVNGKGLFSQELPELSGHAEVETGVEDVWTAGFISVRDNLDLWYIIDDIPLLLESHPKCMGTFVIEEQDFQKSCESWRQKEEKIQPREKIMSRKLIGRSGCVFTVSNGPGGERKRIYICGKTEIESLSIQSSILQAVMRFSGKEISKAKRVTELNVGMKELNEAVHGPLPPASLQQSAIGPADAGADQQQLLLLAQQQQKLLAQQQKQEHMQKCLDNLTFAVNDIRKLLEAQQQQQQQIQPVADSTQQWQQINNSSTVQKSGTDFQTSVSPPAVPAQVALGWNQFDRTPQIQPQSLNPDEGRTQTAGAADRRLHRRSLVTTLDERVQRALDLFSDVEREPVRGTGGLANSRDVGMHSRARSSAFSQPADVQPGNGRISPPPTGGNAARWKPLDSLRS